jgi:hypothetical protein
MKKIFNGLVLTMVLVFTGITCLAQDDGRTLYKQVAKLNQDAVDAIAMYPTETRKIIFEATEYPEVIAKLSAMQTNSQAAFEKLISNFSKEEQEKIWNLTRYDELISDLAANPQMSQDEIDTILVNYPEEIHNTALEEIKNHYDLIIQIDKMNKNYGSDFELLMSGYPPEAITAFREIIKMPEVLDILFDHMQYTVVVGNYYKNNPERVLHKTDSLNLVLTQKNTQETNDWKQSLKDNPEVQKEYTEAAQEYAQDNGYQPADYNAPLTQDVTNYNTNPYNWWFGYPSWYPYDYWIPYPYWYDWGFYYGPGGQIVFIGLPSAYFMDWYFYYPKYCSKYPELSNHYYNYYNKHRESMNYNSISHSVNDWRSRNKNIVTADWDKDNLNRTQRFKEYGKMEMDRQKYNTRNPKKQIEQTDYLQKKQRKYPLLSSDVVSTRSSQKESKSKPVQTALPEPAKKPPVKVPDNYKTTVNERSNSKQTEQNIQPQSGKVQNNNVNRQQPSGYVNPQPNNTISKQRNDNINVQQKNPTPVQRTENSNQIRDAQQYHQNTWNQIQPQTQPVRQPPQQYNATPPRPQENHQVQQPVNQNNQTPSNTKRK